MLYLFHLQEEPTMGKFVEIKSRREVTESWEEGVGSYC